VSVRWVGAHGSCFTISLPRAARRGGPRSGASELSTAAS
jgi:hypothetical protein